MYRRLNAQRLSERTAYSYFFVFMIICTFYQAECVILSPYQLNATTELKRHMHTVAWIEISLTNNIFLLEDFFNPLTPELNPSALFCLTRFLLGILLLESCISLIYA
jgi:hypothetical protein